MIDPVVDRKELLESLDNNTELLQEVIGVFLADCPGKLAELRTAVTACDSDQIARGSHALRGSISIFGAKSAVEAAQTLESMGGQGNVEGLAEAFSVLERQLAQVTSALDQIARDVL
jgi:two-component system sensor histidine kinase/response regulator